MDWLNFRHLYAFWMVWQSNGFRRASQKLHVAQSALSDQVKQFEEYLGKTLLIRGKNRVELTEAGRVLCVYAESIFSKSQEINQVLKNDSTFFFPTQVHVGIVGGISRNFLSKFIGIINEYYPQTRLKIETGSGDELIERLRNHNLHIVFSTELPPKRELDQIAFDKLLESPICLVGSEETLALVKNKSGSQRIPYYEFLFPYRQDQKQYLRGAFQFDPKVLVQSDDIPLLRFLVTSNHGVALLPQIGVIGDLENDRIAAITLPMLGAVEFYGQYLNKGPYQEIAKKLLEPFQKS